MLTKERNDALTRVSKGTPAGELLRRYWQPVAALSELAGKRNRLRVRILGEDLVLFRTSSGELILIAERCAHRGASLYHGFIEADGVRCPYHGIKYDAHGRCLEVPFEPPGSPVKQEICLASYPVRALGGLVFAYLGSGEPPVLPRWDLLVSRRGKRSVNLLPPLQCNWLQIMENSADTTHTFYLHAHMMEVMGHPEKGAYYRRPIEGFDFEIERTPTWYGLRKVRTYGSNGGERERGHPILFPNALYVPHDGNVDVHWRVPIDDTHTRIVRLEFAPADREVDQRDEDVPARYEPSFKNADGEYILDVNFANQDAMAYESQGPIADRTKEYLLAADRGIVLYRKMLEEEMAAVAAGRDPAGVVRDPALDIPIEIAVSRGQALYAREAQQQARGAEKTP
jgi:5,5'-dehydrodivanillate O-demethylase